MRGVGPQRGGRFNTSSPSSRWVKPNSWPATQNSTVPWSASSTLTTRTSISCMASSGGTVTDLAGARVHERQSYTQRPNARLLVRRQAPAAPVTRPGQEGLAVSATPPRSGRVLLARRRFCRHARNNREAGGGGASKNLREMTRAERPITAPRARYFRPADLYELPTTQRRKLSQRALFMQRASRGGWVAAPCQEA